MYESAIVEDLHLTDVQRDLLAITWRMLDAIHGGEADVYADLCAPDLSCYEDVCGYRIDGVRFHTGLIRQMAKNPALKPTRFDVLSPRVQVYGACGIVTYTRLTTYDDGGKPRWTTSNETRVFVKVNNAWKMAHFHRTPTG